MVASKRGVGHKNEDFTDPKTMEQALLVCISFPLPRRE